MDEMSSIQL